MSDQFHHPSLGWSPFDFLLGLGGMLSPWWIKFVHGFDEFVGGVAFYGGALLVAIQLGRLALLAYRKHRGRA